MADSQSNPFTLWRSRRPIIMSFKILVVGDFSAQARVPGQVSPPVPIDLDTFDDVLSTLGPTADIGGDRLTFRELDDFHPDRLYRTLHLAQRKAPANVRKAAPVASAPPARASASLLDDIVQEEEQVHAPVAAADAGDLNAFIRRVTTGHLVQRDDEAEAAERDGAAAEEMRAILHNPAFQSLESGWRGLRFLLSGTDRSCRTYLLDATLPAFLQQLQELQARLQKSGPWDLIIGDFYFGQSETEAAVLERIGSFAAALNGTFICGALPPGDGASERWNSLRHSAIARRLGLVLPRFLLRLPYGPETSSTDAFDFEELPTPEHRHYLWGNGAYIAGFLIGAAYDPDSVDWRRRVGRRIDGLPLHVYQDGTEQVSTPCAEVLMTEQQAEMLLDLGFMPLASLKDQDGAVLVQFRSIASPAASLALLG